MSTDSVCLVHSCLHHEESSWSRIGASLILPGADCLKLVAQSDTSQAWIFFPSFVVIPQPGPPDTLI